LIAHRESDYWTVDAVGAPHIGERSEKELIQAFVDKIAELTPRLVTFNGNTISSNDEQHRSAGFVCPPLLQSVHR
jgi:predicted PolB exonuclease-like 3'-5' exonuclease